MICLRCKQRGERYSRQVARDGGLRFSSKRIRIFAAKAAEVKKRAGRCIGELMEEDRKPGRLARQKAPAQEEKSFHPFVLSRTACPLSRPHAQKAYLQKPLAVVTADHRILVLPMLSSPSRRSWKVRGAIALKRQRFL